MSTPKPKANPSSGADAVVRAVEAGFARSPRALPAWLFYDDEGSRLYELITELPEYYPTRTERGILARHADEMVARAAEGATSPLHVIELGAGTASKTSLILAAVVARQGRCVYMPMDVSAVALDEAQARVAAQFPTVDVRPFLGRHEGAFDAISALGPRRLVLFIGSSIGNLDDDDAVALLRGVRRGLTPGGALLLGTDLRKDPSILVPAYDDAQGVTAAFNLNVLTRLNRELGADFDLTKWRHVALFDDERSRIEMHVESLVDQQVWFSALDRGYAFRAGERVHTESSVKYDLPRVAGLLERAGFQPEATWTDDAGWFAVTLGRAV